MQWTASHIHLAEHHDHDGSHHQHSTEAHSHQLTGHHVDAIDSSHKIGDFTVVELEHKYNIAKVKKPKKQPLASITLEFQAISLPQRVAAKHPEIINTKFSYLDRSNIRPRAPPQRS